MMKRGQMKVQEMAFVLVAIVIFFSLVALAYFSIRINNLKDEAGKLNQESANSLIRKISGTPELAWGECSGCIDFDKALAFKETAKNKSYKDYWKLDYLEIKIIYPEKNGEECNFANYPECSSIILINKSSFGSASGSFVSLCYFDSEIGQERCDIGKIYASGENIDEF